MLAWGWRLNTALHIQAHPAVSRHITHHSWPHHCRRSSLVNCHTSRRGGCTVHLHTETRRLYMWQMSVGGVVPNHTTPETRPTHYCSRSVRHTACFWPGTCQTVRRKLNQQCSSGREPHHSRHHSRLCRCRENEETCTVCCGMQIHLSYTTRDLWRVRVIVTSLWSTYFHKRLKKLYQNLTSSKSLHCHICWFLTTFGTVQH